MGIEKLRPVGPSGNLLSRCGRGRRPGVYQAFRDRLDAEVEPFERTGAEQNQVARFAEDEVVGRTLSRERGRKPGRPIVR
jgi:hypothetical protein